MLIYEQSVLYNDQVYEMSPQLNRLPFDSHKMALQNGEQYSDILRSQVHIWNHIHSFINSMSLKCAIQLEIPDIINRHGAPMKLSELVEALPISKDKSHFVYRLMRMLVQSGFFLVKTNDSKTEGIDEDEDAQRYLLAPACRLLLKDELLSIRPFVLSTLDPVLMDPWHHMSKWFQSEDVNPFDTAHGKTFFNYAGSDPRLNAFFNDAMASDAKLVIDIIIEKCAAVFGGLNSIVDVGGGTGSIAKAIAKAFPNLSCINFDLPHVIAGLEGNENLSYVAGDMFEAIPVADAVLLKWILHDWKDEECLRILKRCKEAVPSKENGGKVMIIDMVVNHCGRDDKEVETQLFFDMSMMVLATGRERNEKEWAKLFNDAGFSHYKITPVLGLRSFIEVFP